MDRRDFLKALGALSGGLVVQQAIGSKALGATLTGLAGSTGASRTSKLGGSLVVVHSDLHNHSLISGDAEGLALAQLSPVTFGVRPAEPSSGANLPSKGTPAGFHPDGCANWRCVPGR